VGKGAFSRRAHHFQNNECGMVGAPPDAFASGDFATLRSFAHSEIVIFSS
jgi:hypothetical protein